MKSLLVRLREAAVDTGAQMKQANLFLVASSLSYTTILSLIPLLALSFAVFKAFGGMDQLYSAIQPFILNNLAEGVSEEAIGQIRDFIGKTQTGTVGLTGFVALIFTSMSMLASIEKAINVIWGVPNRRSFFFRVSTYWMFITLGPLLLAVVLGIASSSRESVTAWLPGWFGIFAIAAIFFFALYKWVPHTKVHWKYALVSAVITSVLWNLARQAYVLYVRHFVHYDRVYGSLSAIPVLLLWIYIVWLLVLAGASLSAALQHRMLAREAQRKFTSGGKRGDQV
jgi:membrane protein